MFTSSTVLSGPGDFKVYETYTPGVKNPGRRRSAPGFLDRIVSSCLERGRTQSSLGSMMFRMFEPEPSKNVGVTCNRHSIRYHSNNTCIQSNYEHTYVIQLMSCCINYRSAGVQWNQTHVGDSRSSKLWNGFRYYKHISMYYVLLVIALTCQYSGFIINKTLLHTQLSNGKTKSTTLYEPMKIAGKIKYTWVDNLPPGVH